MRLQKRMNKLPLCQHGMISQNSLWKKGRHRTAIRVYYNFCKGVGRGYIFIFAGLYVHKVTLEGKISLVKHWGRQLGGWGTGLRGWYGCFVTADTESYPHPKTSIKHNITSRVLMEQSWRESRKEGPRTADTWGDTEGWAGNWPTWKGWWGLSSEEAASSQTQKQRAPHVQDQ